MIPQWTIRVDGRPYGGESTAEEPRRCGGIGTGYSSIISRNKLIFDGPQMVMSGQTNLESHLRRIMDRIRDGMEANRIVIEKVPAAVDTSPCRYSVPEVGK